MNTCKLIFALSLFLTLTTQSYCSEIISTLNGKILGRLDYTDEQETPYYRYEGVPFAEPPIGDRRLEPPVDIGNWKGIKDCTKPKSNCIQFDILQQGTSGDEDCLYLNIYVPQVCFELMCPVFVFLHGGGFISGSGSYDTIYPGHFVEKNVIMVVPNYRLSMLGFFSTCDLTVPGNMGLKDQNCALRWIKKNIARFGGDPNRVTLGGESAGAASVGYHEQCPSCAGTFQRTMKHSGSTLNVWTLSYDCEGKKQIFIDRLSKLTGLPADDINIDILKRLDPKLLQIAGTINAGFNLFLDYHNGFLFGPTSEVPHNGSFFSGISYEGLKDGSYPISDVKETLIGFNSLEMQFTLTSSIIKFLHKLAAVEFSDITRYIPADVIISNPLIKMILAEVIEKRHFSGNETIMTADSCSVLSFLSFDVFSRPIIKNVQFLNQHKRPTYFMQWSYVPSDQPIVCPGVGHGVELEFYVRKWKTFSEKDKEYGRKFVHVIGNFIYHGNPTPNGCDPVLNNIKFIDAAHGVTGDSFNIVDIGEEIKVVQDLYKSNMDFYRDLVFSQNEADVIKTY